MATILPPSSTLHLPNPFPLTSPSPKFHAPPPKSILSFTTRATDPDSSSSSSSSSADEPSESDDAFEDRLSKVRVRYRSGTGKKAERRKTRKKGGSSSSSSSPSGSVFLPPVPLKEPISGGVKVEFGFSPYSERVNGWVAIVGLSALLSVEMATGKSVINYHTPAIVFIQVYFVAAVTALYVKYQKERVSVWPQSSPKE